MRTQQEKAAQRARASFTAVHGARSSAPSVADRAQPGKLAGKERCARCDGSGESPARKGATCSRCNGDGWI